MDGIQSSTRRAYKFHYKHDKHIIHIFGDIMQWIKAILTQSFIHVHSQFCSFKEQVFFLGKKQGTPHHV